jgi:hypothetical protein
MTDDREDFLARWSRRKAEMKAAATPAPAPPPQPPVEAAAPKSSGALDMRRDEPPDEETRKRWVASLEEVDLTKLTYEDDFAVFMKSWVPEPLRRRALARLWETSDLFRLPDGFDDYAGDYALAPVAGGAVKTAWRPGRGFALPEAKEVEAPKLARAAEQGDAPPAPEEERVTDAPAETQEKGGGEAPEDADDTARLSPPDKDAG